MYLCRPRKDNSFYVYNKNIKLSPELIFVFGSNLAGRHGAGSAKEACLRYGAEYGVGNGYTGNSYAIPTKDKRIRTLSLERIKHYTDWFVVLSNESANYFYVTAIGTGLAGYSHSEIAPLFKGAKNCWFPLQWREFLLTKEEIAERLEKGEIYDYAY